jgi:hypothetical protein
MGRRRLSHLNRPHRETLTAPRRTLFALLARPDMGTRADKVIAELEVKVQHAWASQWNESRIGPGGSDR